MINSIQDIGEYFKKNHIKSSLQRIKIFEYLVKANNHPTAEMVYRALVDEMPTLSKTTVYNTLNLFLEKGVVNEILIEENERRYDADMSLHAHHKCKGCNCIINVPMEEDSLDLEKIKGFQIKKHHIYFIGYCDKCSEKMKKG